MTTLRQSLLTARVKKRSGLSPPDLKPSLPPSKQSYVRITRIPNFTHVCVASGKPSRAPKKAKYEDEPSDERVVELPPNDKPHEHEEGVEKMLTSKISPKSLAVIQQVLSNSSQKHNHKASTEFVYSPSSIQALNEIKEEFETIQQNSKENLESAKTAKPSLKEQTRLILDSCPVKIKYEELLLPERALMIPVNFKHVMRVGGALDAVLNYYKARGKLQTFDELRKSIESTYHMNFTLGLFEKLLAVVPEFYSHEWVLLERRRDYSLTIDIPDCFPQIIETNGDSPEIVARLLKESKRGMSGPMDARLLDKRAEVLKNRLIKITAEHHQKFLETIGDTSYDAFRYKTWHHQFKVHTLDLDITERRLKEKPEPRKCLGVGEFLKQNNVKDQLVKAALEEVAKEIATEVETDRKSGTSVQVEDSSLKGLLSDSLIRKIKAKEKAVQEYNRVLEESILANKQKTEQTRLIDLSNTVKAIFVVNGGKAILKSELLEKLRDEERGKYFSADEIRKSIETLMNVAPKWIRKIETGRGTFIKVEKSVSMGDVKNMIETGTNAEH